MSGTSQSTAERLLAAAGGDVDLARELASLFLTELERLLAEGRKAAGAGDALSLERALHTLRGCAGTLGFDEVADAALALELRARNGTILAADLDSGIARLASVCGDADRATRAYLRVK